MNRWNQVGRTKEEEEFEAGLNKAYDILWEMFRPKDGKGCNFNTDYESKLNRIINLIDFELER